METRKFQQPAKQKKPVMNLVLNAPIVSPWLTRSQSWMVLLQMIRDVNRCLHGEKKNVVLKYRTLVIKFFPSNYLL